MVVLSIVTHSSEHTVYFDSPIPKPRFVRLISCTLYNSWYNLKQDGSVAYKRKNKEGVLKLRGRRIKPENYNFKTLADILTRSVAELGSVSSRGCFGTPAILSYGLLLNLRMEKRYL